MNILLLGSGGRESALAMRLAQSPSCSQLFVAPGNPGTAALARNLPIAANDKGAIGKACLEHGIGMVVCGPEQPLVEGMADHFAQTEALRHILFIGPGRDGARLEGSKIFSKDFMLRHGIPTAGARIFSAGQIAEALAYVESTLPPMVVKADGLAAGKGVVVAQTREEAAEAVRMMLGEKAFGQASEHILIEDCLVGIELSCFILTDGKDYLMLPEAKDYKRVGDGDTGPNTGGMGSVSPVPFAQGGFLQKVEDQVVRPTMAGLQKEGIAYVGFLFIGLMMVGAEPFVIEYNARLGDPETQSLMARLRGDLAQALALCAQGRLKEARLETDPQTAVTVVACAPGYPGAYPKGLPISGVPATLPNGTFLFHAGTHLDEKNGLFTDGARVLAATATADSIELARNKAYMLLESVHWEGILFRKDIGLDVS